MTNYKIKILKRLIIVSTLTIVLYFVISVGFYFISSRDVNTAVFEGFVFDKVTLKPISNSTIVILSERYESDLGQSNYDEFLGNDTIHLRSNTQGHYIGHIKKSAYFTIQIFKENYDPIITKGYYTRKRNHLNFYLKKRR